MNHLNQIFIALSIFVLSSCSSLSSLKFWGDDEEEEGPEELYSIQDNRTLEREWSVSNNNELTYGRLIPVIYEGKVFYINSAGYLSSVDLDSGEILWSKNTQDVVSSGLDVNFKTISYGTLDGSIVALDFQDGSELWRSAISSESLSPPANSGSHVIIQTVDGRIAGYDLKSGKQEWFHQTVLPTLTLRGTSRPIIDQGFIFTGFASGKIAMIYPDSGAIRLELPITLNEGKSELERIIDIDGRPIIVNDLLIAASYQGNITAINLRDGRPAWQEELSSFKDLTSNGNRVVAVDEKSILKAFGTATGAIIWDQKDLKLRKLTSPASISNLIAVGDYDGYVHLLNAQSGNFEGREKVSRNPITEIISNGNSLLVVDAAGRVQKFSVE
ncbi:MAG: outer membrane protein assembly factor BamB [SAR86 cluster bacterium]|nr:outer membrane protein assembly factor BamB [SAR86 cluster bacterium]